MTSYDTLQTRIRELQSARFKEFEQELHRRKALSDRSGKHRKEWDRRRRAFMTSIGVDVRKLDEAAEEDNRAEEANLKAFLEELRPSGTGRHPQTGADARDAAIRSQVLAETGHLVLPVFASSIVAADRSPFKEVVGLDWTQGAIDSGWVFPDDPSKIRIKDTRHYANALCWDNREWGPQPPEFAAHFTFVPATTATYEMTAVLAFHGFYVLRCDDSWWNCRDSLVRLTAQMNVHQYTDVAWKNFPPLLEVEKNNAEEVTSYDRTHFLDYTTGLRAGDPVVVTVKGVVLASAHGGGAYAELNFMDGTANYIEPLFLSVLQV